MLRYTHEICNKLCTVPRLVMSQYFGSFLVGNAPLTHCYIISLLFNRDISWLFGLVILLSTFPCSGSSRENCWLFELRTLWSLDKLQVLDLHYRNACDNQTQLGGNSGENPPPIKSHDPLSPSIIMSVDAKLGRLVTYHEGVPAIKSHDFLIMYSPEITRQIKNVISLLSPCL